MVAVTDENADSSADFEFHGFRCSTP
jgi:hypothetical protein